MTMRRDRYLPIFLSLFDRTSLELRSLSVDGGPVGWPCRISVRGIEGTALLVDLYLGIVHSHSRQSHEYRFQGPANSDNRAIISRNGIIPLLLGIDISSTPHVLVAGNAAKYVGKEERQTVLFHRQMLAQIQTSGWAEYHSSTGETIHGLLPELLPLFLEMTRQDIELPDYEISRTIRDAGQPQSEDDETRRRVMTALARLVRDYRFTRDVVQAYGGRCAISDLNWGIVQAAHIFPVSAPGSTDHISNGIGLTPTYHSLFDKHRIYISPSDYSIKLHPVLRGDTTAAARGFLTATLQIVRVPSNRSQRPNPEMLVKRYAYYGDAYSWASS